jgi:hypothetical protein
MRIAPRLLAACVAVALALVGAPGGAGDVVAPGFAIGLAPGPNEVPISTPSASSAAPMAPAVASRRSECRCPVTDKSARRIFVTLMGLVGWRTVNVLVVTQVGPWACSRADLASYSGLVAVMAEQRRVSAALLIVSG